MCTDRVIFQRMMCGTGNHRANPDSLKISCVVKFSNKNLLVKFVGSLLKTAWGPPRLETRRMAYSKFSDQSDAEMTSRIMMITQVARTVSTATSCSEKGE